MHKGQFKIQEMAFVLVAIAIFFALVALLYFSVRLRGLERTAGEQSDDVTALLVQKLANLPELRAGCAGCIDLDKAFVLGQLGMNKRYATRWGIDYLEISLLYPDIVHKQCTSANYPLCDSLVLLNESKSFGTASKSFVALCRWDAQGAQERCSLGVLYASGRSLNAR